MKNYKSAGLFAAKCFAGIAGTYLFLTTYFWSAKSIAYAIQEEFYKENSAGTLGGSNLTKNDNFKDWISEFYNICRGK